MPQPALIAYDGTAARERAVRAAAALLSARGALVVVVIKPGLAFELIELPASSSGLPPAPVDVWTALGVERSLIEGAQEGAQQGATLARRLGLAADPLVVAEDPDITIAETLLRVAREQHASAIVLGAHAHGPILGATVRSTLRAAAHPVLVVPENAAPE